LRDKERPVRKVDLTAICEPIVWKMWELRGLTILWASTVCYRDSVTSLALHVSAVQNHHQVHVYLAKTVPLYVKITYRDVEY
jgi:hypothetical protein